jgi:hypothetical protein
VLARRAAEILKYWNDGQPGEASAGCTEIHAAHDQSGYHLAVNSVPDGCTYPDLSAVLRGIEMHAALQLLDRRDQVVSVHAGLLERGNRGVLIVGPSHSGKSTLSCALWHAGWSLLTDDVALLNRADIVATPLLRRVSLRHPSRELLGDELWTRMKQVSSCDETPEGYVFHPDELVEKSRARAIPVCAIFFLARRGAPDLLPAQTAALDSARALLSIAPYTNQLQDNDLGAAIKRLAPLLGDVRAYDLARGPIPEMIAAIERALS